MFWISRFFHDKKPKGIIFNLSYLSTHCRSHPYSTETNNKLTEMRMRLFVPLLATFLSVANGQDLDTVLTMLTNAVGDVTTLNTCK